jgi:hypothetical protein
MEALNRRIPLANDVKRGFLRLLDAEWLTASGLEGDACGTIAGCSTRRYHGLCSSLRIRRHWGA